MRKMRRITAGATTQAKRAMKKDKGAKAPKSTVERQAAFRARKTEAGKAEVRGIYATPEQAEKVKKYAERIK